MRASWQEQDTVWLLLGRSNTCGDILNVNPDRPPLGPVIRAGQFPAELSTRWNLSLSDFYGVHIRGDLCARGGNHHRACPSVFWH